MPRHNTADEVLLKYLSISTRLGILGHHILQVVQYLLKLESQPVLVIVLCKAVAINATVLPPLELTCKCRTWLCGGDGHIPA
jgi:hypothetical protein